jgi:hypothetical protein
MGLPGARKRDLVVDCLTRMQRHWTVGPMSAHVAALERRAGLRRRDPGSLKAA